MDTEQLSGMVGTENSTFEDVAGVVYSSDVPVSDSRFDKLGSKVDQLSGDFAAARERIAKLEAVRDAPRPTLQTLLYVVCAGIVGYQCWLGREVYHHGNQLASMQSDIRLLLEYLPAAKLTALADAEPTVESLTQAQKVIENVKNDKTPLPPQVIKSVGSKFIDAASSHPQVSDLAWKTTLQLIDYRSSLNALQNPAYTEPLSRPQSIASETLPKGIRLVFQGGGITGFTQELDGVMWENMTFRNCRIIYKGGPVVLKNVRFENCQFEIQLTPRSKELGESLLASIVTISIVS